MQALRIELDGVTTSFRLPHFLVGRQPSYPLPPPATIYGHIASAVGDFPDPAGLRFAYSFSVEGRVDDMETALITEVGGSVPREDKARFPYPVNITATPGPLMREVLVRPRLVLYLDAPGRLDQLYRAFREPRYMVILGRSQDLASYRRVDLIETEERDSGYVEGSLVRPEDQDRYRAAIPMIMPRFIDPDDRRRVAWSPYRLLAQRCYLRPAGSSETSAAHLIADPDERFDVDPGSPVLSGLQRILYWHGFTEGDT